MDVPYAEDEIDPVFRAITNHWMTKIVNARDHKRKVFQEAANECQSFYNGPRSWEDAMMGQAGFTAADETIEPTFRVNVNKTFEFVTLFGPAMYYENPVRTVKPRMPFIVPPQFFAAQPLVYQALAQQENLRVMSEGLTAGLIESVLNWTPKEFDLETESRLAIDEALIKGRGLLWTELYSPPGTEMKVVKSSWDSTDNLLVDPDAYQFKKAQWIARRCIHPVWQVERDFGLRPGSIKGNLESQAKQADIEVDEDGEYNRRRGFTNDLLIYYKIYSRMGIGGRLQGLYKGFQAPLEMFGDYAYLVIADGVPYPLNLNPDIQNDPQFQGDPNAIFSRVAWPTPFWGADEWPVTELDFHAIHNCPWPMPHLKAGMGELKFLNWCTSFLMGKIRNTTRDFIAIRKDAPEEMKTAILEGKDLTLLEIDSDNPGKIDEIVSFLTHPEVNGDIWKMIAAVEENFDKRVGLNELMYGAQGQTQIRSAEEFKGRSANMSVRPDDMRKKVEGWMARVAAKEAIAARYHLLGADVQPVIGSMGAWAWGQYVQTKDLNVACRQLEYRIEAGSTSRPNKEHEIDVMDTAFSTLAPIFQAYAQQTFDMAPLNNLTADYAKALDLDPTRYQLSNPVMAAPIPGTQPGAPAGDTDGPGHQNQATTNIAPPG